MWMWGLVTLFFAILLVLVLVNAKINGGFKIETSWIAIALSPAVILLIATGQLAEFSGFGLGFKLREASSKSFSLGMEGDRIEPVEVEMETKGGPAMIDQMIDRRVSALSLQLNREGYYADWAIREYLERLTPHEFFHYVVFVERGGAFYGLIPAKEMLAQIREGDLKLVKMIEERTIDRLPGLITASVSTSSSKREALKLMEKKQLTDLPVVDDQKRFVGMVERDKLTSSIVLQLIAGL